MILQWKRRCVWGRRMCHGEQSKSKNNKHCTGLREWRALNVLFLNLYYWVMDGWVKNIFPISLPPFRPLLWAEWIRISVDMQQGRLFPYGCMQRIRGPHWVGSSLQELLWSMPLPCGVPRHMAVSQRIKMKNGLLLFLLQPLLTDCRYSYQDCNWPSGGSYLY